MNGRALRLVTLMAAAALTAGCSDPEPPPAAVVQPVKVMAVGAADTTVKRDFPATVRATERAIIAFQVPGKLVALPVKEGQAVDKGALLAQLDDADYRANVAAAQAEVDQTEGNFKRAQELVDKNYVSQAEYDKIKAAYDVARTKLDKARKALDDTRLQAPFPGVVARIMVDNYQEVRAKEPVLSLQNNNALELVVNVPESLVLRRDQGASLRLGATFEAIPGKTFDLTVKEFATEADPDTQTFQYVLGLDQTSGHNLLPGMTATVHVAASSDTRAGRVIIPLSALVAGADGVKSVWVVGDDNQVRQRAVVTGELSGADSIAVLDGLGSGDRVVVAGTASLVTGMAVKPVEQIAF